MMFKQHYIHDRCERNWQFGTWFSRGFVRSIFLPRLQGNNRIAFLSWPWLTYVKPFFFLICYWFKEIFVTLDLHYWIAHVLSVKPTFSISTIAVMAGRCWSKFVHIKPATVTDAYFYWPKAAATTPVKTRRGVHNPIRYERMLCT